jgi:VanZ family protein
MPFAGFLEFDHQSAVRIVAAKFFLYGAAVWTLRETGLALWGSAGVVTLLLALGEAAQRYLPGRVPESTDPLLALFAAVLMVWLKDRPATR